MGALPYLCKDLIAANRKWQDMIDHIQTTQTQAFQLWLTRSTPGLGWQSREPPVLSTYVEPLDTWADNSHLIDREDWPAEANVRQISYFCGPLQDPDHIPDPSPDPSFPASQAQRAKDEALHFLRTAVRPLWPQATDPNNHDGLDWSLLVDLTGAQGEQRFDRQYWRANVAPSERYVLSVKGSTSYRLPSDSSGFDNLYLAGDWTYNGLNAGCVEAASMSGMQVSRAICGQPAEIIGETDLLEI